MIPYKVHTVLTDNGTHFTTPGTIGSAASDIRAAMDAGELFWAHAFEYACAENDIDHRLTKPKHPWTNGQVERMNRTIKDATAKRFYYDTHDQLRIHLADFVTGYFNYHAVPTNTGALAAFRAHVVDLWRRTLRRRSQKDASTWKRIARIADDWLPKPRILHPWPHQRFVMKHPRWEPYAGIPHLRICAGGAL